MVYEIIRTQLGSFSSPIYTQQTTRGPNFSLLNSPQQIFRITHLIYRKSRLSLRKKKSNKHQLRWHVVMLFDHCLRPFWQSISFNRLLKAESSEKNEEKKRRRRSHNNKKPASHSKNGSPESCYVNRHSIEGLPELRSVNSLQQGPLGFLGLVTFKGWMVTIWGRIPKRYPKIVVCNHFGTMQWKIVFQQNNFWGSVQKMSCGCE